MGEPLPDIGEAAVTGYFWIGYRWLNGTLPVRPHAIVYLVVGNRFVPLTNAGSRINLWSLDPEWRKANRLPVSGSASEVRDVCTFTSPNEALDAAGAHLDRHQERFAADGNTLSVYGPHPIDLNLDRSDWTASDWVALWAPHYEKLTLP